MVLPTAAAASMLPVFLTLLLMSVCTVLAEAAMPLEDIDRAEVEADMRTAREDLAEAKDDNERVRLEQAIAVGEAKIAALDSPVY